VTALDRLELAFYWLLLDGQRGDGDYAPHGYLILKDDAGAAEPKRIELLDRHFIEVLRLVEAVRRLRTLPEPFGCGQCYTCREGHPQTVETFIIQRADGYLGSLFGLGFERIRHLGQVGVHSCDDLLNFGVDEVLDRVTGHGWSFGRYQVAGWVAHAQAFAENRLVVYGSPPPMPTEYVAFDLEYMRGGPIWLAGMLAPGAEPTQLWRWSEEDERPLMREIVAYWADRPDAVMLTWWGKGADLPTLRAASERTGVEFVPNLETHFDLCHWAMGHLRLPIQGLSLKDVAAYFDVARSETEIGSGDEAVGVYIDAAAKGPRARSKARTKLEAYNADDLRGTIELIEVLRGTYLQVPVAPSPRTRKLAWLRASVPPVRISDRIQAVDPDAWIDEDDVTFFA
jgi:predicted RecB family nuclease